MGQSCSETATRWPCNWTPPPGEQISYCKRFTAIMRSFTTQLSHGTRGGSGLLRRGRRITSTSVAVTGFAIAALMPWPALAQEEPGPPASTAAMVVPYELVCASCHDNQSGENLAPLRQTLRQMPPERVYAAMTAGPMAAFAAWPDGRKFEEDELRAMSELITGKPFGDTVDRTAAGMSNQCSAPLALDDPFSKPAWNGWTPDPTKSYRYQSAANAGIAAADIPKLKLKWAFAFPDAASAAWTQPSVVGGTVFIGSDNEHVLRYRCGNGLCALVLQSPRPGANCSQYRKSNRHFRCPLRRLFRRLHGLGDGSECRDGRRTLERAAREAFRRQDHRPADTGSVAGRSSVCRCLVLGADAGTLHYLRVLPVPGQPVGDRRQHR